MHQVTEFLVPVGREALSMLVHVVGVVVGSAPVWGPVAWKIAAPLVRAGILRATNAQTAQAFAAVELAVKPAVNVAMESITACMRQARAPNSPGGSVVTEDEYRAAVAKAGAAAWAQLDQLGTIRSVAVAYGGEEAVKRAFQVLLERALSQHHDVDKPAGV